MADLGETMKKVLLAGIGAAAETTEKAEQLLNDMVKKGELTIEQGKVLNKELRHNIDEKLKSSKEKAYAQQNRKPDVSEFLKSLSDDDLRELKNRLAATMTTPLWMIPSTETGRKSQGRQCALRFAEPAAFLLYLCALFPQEDILFSWCILRQ